MQPLSPEVDARLSHWLEEHANIRNAKSGPLLAGGNANVTRLIESEGKRFVMRHPPVHVISDKAAAGISREYKALKALHGQAPVPAPVAWCDDNSVIGQNFAIIEWLDGVALTTDIPQNYLRTSSDVDAINALGRAMIGGLAAVHAAKVRDKLPENFGQPSHFVERQITRWLDQRATHQVRELPLLQDIARWLLDNRPECETPSLIHCDFHLDNCLVGRETPDLVGILDWEMATLGDPLIDLGLCLFFWRRDASKALGFAQVQGLTNNPKAMSRQALADLWSEKSGYDHRHLTYYIVFSAWRLAAIVEGAYVLYRRGQDDRPYTRSLEHDVPNLLLEAAAHIEGKAA